MQSERAKLLIAIYRLGSKDALGEADQAQAQKDAGLSDEQALPLLAQLHQLGFLKVQGVSVGSLKLTGSGINAAKRAIGGDA